MLHTTYLVMHYAWCMLMLFWKYDAVVIGRCCSNRADHYQPHCITLYHPAVKEVWRKTPLLDQVHFITRMIERGSLPNDRVVLGPFSLWFLNLDSRSTYSLDFRIHSLKFWEASAHYSSNMFWRYQRLNKKNSEKSENENFIFSLKIIEPPSRIP